MIFRRRWLVLVACLLASVGSAEEDASSVRPTAITLDDAFRLALQQSPELAAQRAAVEEARARLVTAAAYPFNPELALSAGRRRSGAATGTDRGVELSQEIELGGQTSRRAAAARLDVEAAEERYRRAGQFLMARVELSFADSVQAAQSAEVDEADLALAEASLDVSRRRLAAGATTELELNLAVATRARAVTRLQQSRAATDVARFLLAEALGVSPSSAPTAAPAEPDLSRDIGSLDSLLALAAERRADLASFRALIRAADARIRLARAERVPSLRLGLFHDTEGGGDVIDGGSIGVALPIFNHRKGPIAEAIAGRARAEAEGEVAARAVEREVAESWAMYRAARATVEALGSDVIGSLEGSLELLRKSQEVGKIAMTEVLLFRRELLDSRRDYLAARGDAWRARVLLNLAAGITPVPDVAMTTETTMPATISNESAP